MTDLPIAVGFGIKTPEQAAEIAGARRRRRGRLGPGRPDQGEPGRRRRTRRTAGLVDDVLGFVGQLAEGVRSARR